MGAANNWTVFNGSDIVSFCANPQNENRIINNITCFINLSSNKVRFCLYAQLLYRVWCKCLRLLILVHLHFRLSSILMLVCKLRDQCLDLSCPCLLSKNLEWKMYCWLLQ